MILIIDSEEAGRQQAYKAFKNVDGRRKIEIAANGLSAWEIALDSMPVLVICADTLPDTSGFELCQRLRQPLPYTIYLGYGSNKNSNGFDGWLNKPPARISIISCLTMMKEREDELRLQQLRCDDDFGKRRRHKTEQEQRRAGDSQLISVCMEEPNALKFNLETQPGLVLKEFLSRLGKKKITSYFLVRNGAKVAATDDTVLATGDQVVIRTE